MSGQNPPVLPASPDESYDFLLEDGIRPESMSELDMYKAVAARLYLERRGAICWNCDSANIKFLGKWRSDDDWVDRAVECQNCGATWTDVYTLSSVTNMVLPEEKS